eukprot:12512095-Ditylum_brightwellii.AAC.1
MGGFGTKPGSGVALPEDFFLITPILCDFPQLSSQHQGYGSSGCVYVRSGVEEWMGCRCPSVN